MTARYVITPCRCKHKQSTKVKPGDIIRCTKCKKPFTEKSK